MASIIKRLYESNARTRSDINEHLPALREFAQHCDSIAAMGVRDVVSTWAFLAGLCEYPGPKPTHMHCVDIDRPHGINLVGEIAKEAGIELVFYQADSAKVSIPPVDMLFIDTWHVYGHLKRELRQHVDDTTPRKYIILHNTEVDKTMGESVRLGMNIAHRVQVSGYPQEEITCGLERAIQEFLTAQNGKWVIRRHFKNNNGLTILARVTDTPA